MMWFVRLALIRPYTFIVFAIFILLVGILTITRMSTDIFPEIDIPVVSVVWTYTGMSPDEMTGRIVTVSERAMTTTVNDIEHIESQSLNGVSVIKVFFHPGAKVEAAVAQITSISQAVLRALPPGITPPFIIRYNASSVPILQVGIHSKTLSEQALFDYGLNFIRTQLATVQGASVPLPLGGKSRQVMIDINPQAMYSYGISPTDIVNAINAQNVILPAGTAKMGDREYVVKTNSSPDLVANMNNFPLKQVHGATIFIRDVAQVHDGYAVQTNVVRQDGRRGTLLTILKASGASTLDVVERVKKALPAIQATLPPALQMNYLFDQSVFVKASIDGVIRESIIASCLTGLMILLFLGSWRSTLIVVISIPLSILCSIIFLQMTGQDLNVMTLGGLALAIGMLVDDATVEIENIHRNQHLTPQKTIQHIILVGAQQVATPALVSTLSICIVFLPVMLVTGAAKSLFIPLAMAVVYAMLASYILSRTLVPVLAMYLIPHQQLEAESTPPPTLTLAGEGQGGGGASTSKKEKKRYNPFSAFHEWFEKHFENLRTTYRHDLEGALKHRGLVILLFLLFFGVSFLILPFIGQDFFPSVDAGQLRLHVRAPTGTRIESTEHYFSQVETVIRQIIPPKEISVILDNIGLPNSGINLAFSDNATLGAADGEILVALNPEYHAPTAYYMRKLRSVLNKRFPGLIFFFQPADIVTQILNFGLPAPIDVQIVGRSPKNYQLAQELRRQVSQIPGAVDVHVHQILDVPEYLVKVDRERANQMGMTEQAVANNLLVALSSSFQTAPNFWLDPKNGVSYNIAAQTPQYKINSVSTLMQSPISVPTLPIPEPLSNLATIQTTITPEVVNHYNVQPTFDIYANVQDRDLGGVSKGINMILSHYNLSGQTPGQMQGPGQAANPPHSADQKKLIKLPKGTKIVVRGQVESMNSSFSSLGLGLILAIVLVYLLMVVNFQSWVDPLIIMMGSPATFSGILWGLFTTGTTFSVPSLMGAIMSIGVSTANSILVVSFANDQRADGMDATQAALAAGYTRFRPVIMTALAMIMGMLPMALGVGEGGEQNAPLGRAVIGGLFIATFSTLFFIPLLYSIFRKKYTPPLVIEDDV